MKCPIIS